MVYEWTILVPKPFHHYFQHCTKKVGECDIKSHVTLHHDDAAKTNSKSITLKASFFVGQSANLPVYSVSVYAYMYNIAQ